MAQIIILEKNRPLRDLLTLNLKTFTGSEVIEMDDFEKCGELLRILPAVDLIITRAEFEKEYWANDFSLLLHEIKREIPLIAYGHSTNIPQDAHHLKDEKRWEDVLTSATKILGISTNDLLKKPKPEFISIPIHYFLLIDHAICDVFIRIKKSPTEFQYIKRLHGGDDYLRETIERYISQGLRDFYIPKEFEINFTNYASDQLVLALENARSDYGRLVEVVAQSYDLAIGETRRLGFTPATIQLTDSIIDSIQKTFEKSPQLGGLIHKIVHQKSSFMYQHCHLTNLLVFESLVTAKKAGPQMQEIFGYASFFHDIDLVEFDDLTRINDIRTLEHAHLDKSKLDLVVNHALSGSLLLKKHPAAPPLVSKLILEHHGAQDGVGLLERFPIDLSFETRLFIVCERFVHRFLEYKDSQKDIRPVLVNLYNAFVEPEMIEVAKILEATLARKQKEGKRN